MHATPETIGEMLARGEGVRVGCTRCKSGRKVDLEKLVAIKGPHYSLFNRRCPCRMLKDCPGYNRFYTTSGFGRKLWDEATGDRWDREDWAERLAELKDLRVRHQS